MSGIRDRPRTASLRRRARPARCSLQRGGRPSFHSNFGSRQQVSYSQIRQLEAASRKPRRRISTTQRYHSVHLRFNLSGKNKIPNQIQFSNIRWAQHPPATSVALRMMAFTWLANVVVTVDFVRMSDRFKSVCTFCTSTSPRACTSRT